MSLYFGALKYFRELNPMGGQGVLKVDITGNILGIGMVYKK